MLPLYMLEDGQVKEALFVFQGQEHDPLSASRGGCVDDNRFSGRSYPGAMFFPPYTIARDKPGLFEIFSKGFDDMAPE